ncbi:hypothetical protein [Psychroflexus planctonicus]|uniref:Uncharacterized protein n=1 Tax=Psychroflexus planctonicus TaxID=1526575 RepID=A0ABQ1SCB2_9FLAO|nr:hypothetical protein [Psychroflexus planctonicus]GGE27503.1 hypothetical protein GCM10010832_05240 [Psychroflexus planctonicus]
MENIKLSLIERFKTFKPKSNIIIYDKCKNFDFLHRIFLLFDIPVTVLSGEDLDSVAKTISIFDLGEISFEDIPEKLNIKIGENVDTKDLKSIISLLEPFGLKEVVYLNDLESNTIYIGGNVEPYQEIFTIKKTLGILENTSVGAFLKNMWKDAERDNNFRLQQQKDSYYGSMNDDFYRQAFDNDESNEWNID